MPKAPNPASWHHYVPQFLLAPWTTPEPVHTPGEVPVQRLWVTRLVGERASQRVHEERKPTISVAAEERLYTQSWGIQEFPDPPVDRIETGVLQKLDTDASRVHHRLLTGHPQELTPEERETWARFVLVLLMRDPRVIQAHQQRLAPTIEQRLVDFRQAHETPDSKSVFDMVIGKLSGNTTYGRHLTLASMQTAIEDPSLTEEFKSRLWCVATVEDEDCEFIITNRPVCLDPEPADDFFLMMPISPKKIFLAVKRHPGNEVVGILLGSYNAWVLGLRPSCVYSRSRISKHNTRQFEAVQAALLGKPLILD